MDVARRLAVSNFYREEFLRHIEHLQAAGILDESNRELVDRACRVIVTRLEHVCDESCFHALAETLLQRFDTLSGLSSLDVRQRH